MAFLQASSLAGAGLNSGLSDPLDDELALLEAKLNQQLERSARWVERIRQQHEVPSHLPPSPEPQPRLAPGGKSPRPKPEPGMSFDPAGRKKKGRANRLQEARRLDHDIALRETRAGSPTDPDTASEWASPVLSKGQPAERIRQAQGFATAIDEQVAAGSWLQRQRSGRFVRDLPQFLRLNPRELQDITGALVGKYAIRKELGAGGSGTVSEAEVLVPDPATGLLLGDRVAIKAITYRGPNEEHYLKEGFIDVGFFSVLGALHQAHVCPTLAIFDIIYSARPFGRIGVKAALPLTSHPVLSVVMQLADGTKGRFATSDDPEFDPMDDVMLLEPFDDFEVFQLVYLQLVAMAALDCKVFDLMLRGELRGDNLGRRRLRPSDAPGMAYQAPGAPDSVLWFPTPCSLLYFIDLGQGIQPHVEALHRQGLIGNPMPSSSLEDDGLGRYWPPEALYTAAKPTTALGQEVLSWASSLKISDATAAGAALPDLFKFFLRGGYGAPLDSPEVQQTVVWGCDPVRLARARRLNPLSDCLVEAVEL